MFVRRYDFDLHHDKTKQSLSRTDPFVYGVSPLSALLFFGDLTTARAGFAKVIDAHKRILARVRQGMASAAGCACACMTH